MEMYCCNICGEYFFEEDIIINENGIRGCPICELDDYELCSEDVYDEDEYDEV